MRSTGVLVLCVMLLGPPAAASASTVGLQTDPRLGILLLQADPGEANDVRVSLVDGGRAVQVEDRGAPLAAMIECRQVDASTARCPTPHRQRLTVLLGDGDDRFATSEEDVVAEVRGGAGDDSLTGGPGRDVLSGNTGRDLLEGRGGDDHLSTDGDDDGHDLIDGGPGRDSMSYGTHPRPVRVDLARPLAGPGRLRSVEQAGGSGQDDRLLGDAGPNVLQGVGGEDRIDGRGGDDVLSGAGDLRGGRGDDAIESLGGRVACGPGLDRVAAADRANFSRGRLRPARPPRLAQDCELLEITRFPFDAAAPLELDLRARRRGRYVVRCPARSVRRCRGSLQAGRVADRFAVRPGERRTLRVRSGRRLTLTAGARRVRFILG